MDVRAALTAIDRAAGMEALSNLLAVRDECGLAHLVYHAVHVPGSKPNPLLLLTYDDSWVRRYVAQDYFASIRS